MADIAKQERTLTDILDKLLAQAGAFAELKIRTELTEIPDSAAEGAGPEGDGVAAARPVPSAVADSRINILTADISSSLPKDFFDGDKAAFRDYHLKQIALSREIMQTNLKTVAEVIAGLRGSGS